MKSTKKWIKSMALALSLAVVASASIPVLYAKNSSAEDSDNSIGTEKEYVVLFEEGVNSSTQRDILNEQDVNIVEELSDVNTVLVSGEASQTDALKQTAGVKGVLENEKVPVKNGKAKSNQDQAKKDIEKAKQDKSQSESDEIIGWNIKRLRVDQAWNSGKNTAGKNVKIALWDTGALESHPDLNIHKTFNATAIGGKKDITDHYVHGTSMAGIMAAQKNGQGVVGVAPEAKLSIVKIAESDSYDHGSEDYGYVSPMAVAKAFDWSIKNKMQVIEMTVGWFEQELLDFFGDQETVDAFVDVFQNGLNRCYDNGIVCIAPALNVYSDVTGDPNDPGPDDRDSLRVPQNLDHLILASATGLQKEQEIDENGNPVTDTLGYPVYKRDADGNYIYVTDANGDYIDKLADYSCYANENVNNKNYICAPGENITTTVPPKVIETMFVQEITAMLRAMGVPEEYIPTQIEAMIADGTIPTDIYYYSSERGGSSASNAEIAGVCTLIIGAMQENKDYKKLSGRELVDTVWTILTTTATKIGGVEYDAQGRNHEYGYGLANAKAAVDMALGK